MNARYLTADVFTDKRFGGNQLAVVHGVTVVLQLSVEAGNVPAQRLYRRMGFTTYGVERRSLKVGEHFHDEELMALDLDCG